MAAWPTAVGIVLGVVLVFLFHHLSGYAEHARKHDKKVSEWEKRDKERQRENDEEVARWRENFK